MTREQLFEQRLTDWLEDGPMEAPDRALEVAFAHARSHPRRRTLLVGLGRAAMNRIHLADVTPGQPHRSRLTAFATVAAAVVIGVALVGGGALLLSGGPAGPGQGGPIAASPAPTPTPIPTVAPTPSPAPTPTPTALPPGAVATTGTQAACSSTVEGPEATVDGMSQKRDAVRVCTDTQSDPRVSGTNTLTFNYDEHPDGTWTYWGTSRLTNDSGSWTGVYDGLGPNDYTATMNVYLKGEGGYAGLQYHGTAVLGGAVTPLEGIIEPLGPVEVTSSESCTEKEPGESGVSAAGLDYTRGEVQVCTDVASDPRVAGETTIVLTREEQPDGSWTYDGEVSLRNAGGSWAGVVEGTSEPNAAVAHLTGRWVGAEGYAGLTYVASVTLRYDSTATITGTITPAP
jgi:hypothetical protein